MREIKFRAWDKKNKIMGNVLIIDHVGEATEGLVIEHKKVAYDLDFKKDYILMQYTGLKDKDGKEIYEGDIVKISHRYKGRKHTGAIIWNVYEWHVANFYFSHYDNPASAFSEGTNNKDVKFEIIGNIYENPELV